MNQKPCPAEHVRGDEIILDTSVPRAIVIARLLGVIMLGLFLAGAH